MFELPKEPTSGLVFLNLLLLYAVFIFLKRSLEPPYHATPHDRTIAVILMLLFVLFPFWGADWFHYFESYDDLEKGYPGHLEQVYVWIAQHLSFDYISFRFFVWGSSLLLVLLAIERIPVQKDLALLFFGSFWIIWLSYARVSLGLALAFWGFALFYHPYRLKLLSRIIAIFAILSSFIFHKTAFVFIAAILLTLLANKLNRKILFVLAVISIPMAVTLLQFFSVEIMFVNADASEGGLEQSLSSGQFYLGQDANSKGIGGPGEQVAKILEPIPYYLLAFQGALIIIKQKMDNAFHFMHSLILLYLIIVIISSLFLFNYGVPTAVLYTRFLRFAAIPSGILLAFFWEHKFYPRLSTWTLRFALLSTLYSVLYSIYLANS